MFMQTRHEMIDNLPENLSELKQQQQKNWRFCCVSISARTLAEIQFHSCSSMDGKLLLLEQ